MRFKHIYSPFQSLSMEKKKNMVRSFCLMSSDAERILGITTTNEQKFNGYIDFIFAFVSCPRAVNTRADSPPLVSP